MVRNTMPQKLLIFIVVLLNTAPLFAQFDFPPMSGASAAMGGASVALSDNGTALYNVAGLARMERAEVSLAVRQGFLEEGLGYASVGGAVPTSFGSWAASVVHYGNSDYNEQQVSMAYAMPIGEFFSLGAAFHYLHSGTSDPYYDQLHRFTFSLAMQYFPSDELTVGFKAYNPVAVVAENAESVPVQALFNLGVAYRILDELLAVAEVEKNLYYQSTLRFALQYQFNDAYALRVGLNTKPVIYTFGAGVQFDHLGADFSVQIHNVLGMTPLLSAHYSF